MTAPTAASVQAARATPVARGMFWPLQDAAAAIDSILAEVGPRNPKLCDAVLDLRTLCTANVDAGACVAQLLRVRQLLDGRCHLAFYRVRWWVRRMVRIEVRLGRGAAWISCELPRDAARMEEMVNTALATAAHPGPISAAAQARFVFTGQSNG